MIFSPAPDSPKTGLIYRLQSFGGRVEVGVYPVIFGWRVRAGYGGSDYCELDWCCGGNIISAFTMRDVLLRYLRKLKSSRDCFAGLPETSRIKPLFRDLDFLNKVAEATGEPVQRWHQPDPGDRP